MIQKVVPDHFQLKVPLGVTFLQSISFLKKNDPMSLYERFGTLYNANFDTGA